MKEFINKILNVPKLIFRLWILLWIILILLLILKYCFNIWYPIAVDNQIFIDVCSYIDNNLWLYKLISFILYVLNATIIALTCMNRKHYYSILLLLIFIITIPIIGISKIANSTVGNLLEVLVFFPTVIIINIKTHNFNKLWKNILIPIIVYGVINLWQLSIFLVRGLNLDELKNYPMLIPLILQLDYYVFTIIIWIGVSYMSWFGIGWLWAKDATELKALKAKELSKKHPRAKFIEEINKVLADKYGINE